MAWWERWGASQWLSVAALVVALMLGGAFYWFGGGPAGGAAPVAAAVIPPLPAASPILAPEPAAPPATPAPTPSTTATLAPTATLATTFAVSGTAGLGLTLRTAPATGTRLKGLADGELVVALGPEASADGRLWRQVRDRTGAAGWVAAEFLSAVRPTVLPATATATSLPSPTPSPTPQPTATPARFDLELLAGRGYTRGGYVVVEGELRNTTARELRFVWAVVDWYDAQGQLVKSHTVPIKRDPLPAGQTSGFQISAVGQPNIAYYQLTFKELRAGPLSVAPAAG